jgi:hypothetical protein
LMIERHSFEHIPFIGVICYRSLGKQNGVVFSAIF